MTVPDKNEYDPVFLHARREAVAIILLFCGFCTWAVTICMTQGYLAPGEAPTAVHTTFGMPTWTFWGILVPWLAVDLVAVWFCFFYMKSDDLGTTREEEDLIEHVQHMTDGEAHDD